MTSDTFWKLVQHETINTGNCRKASRRKITGKWWIAYIILVIVIGFVGFTFMSNQKDFHMENIWFFSLGLPYVIFFIGHGLVKKEWDNETQGWWLTMPYSRNKLIGAKFLGSLFRTACVLLGVYVLAGIYALYLTFIQSGITFHDLNQFLVTGLNWMVLLLFFSPITLSMGMTTAITPYTVLRPIVPLLWFLFMFMGSFIYWGVGNSSSDDKEIFTQFVGEGHVVFFKYSVQTIISFIISWILCFIIIRLLGYLLDKKLAL